MEKFNNLRSLNPEYDDYSDEDLLNLVAYDTGKTRNEVESFYGYSNPDANQLDANQLDANQLNSTNTGTDKDNLSQNIKASDVAKSFASGSNKLVSAYGSLWGLYGNKYTDKISDAIREFGNRGSDYWENEKSEAGKQISKDGVFKKDKDDLELSDKWVQSAVLASAESLPSMIAGMGVGAAATKAITSGISKLASLGLIGKTGSAVPLMTGAASATTLGGRVTAAIPSAIGMGAGEGLISGGQASSDIVTKISQMDEQELSKSPVYIAYREAGLTHEDARNKIARQASGESFLKTGASTAIIGALTGGGGLGTAYRAATDQTKKSIIKESLKGMATEAIQEAPQSAGEQYISNLTEQKYLDPNTNLSAGVKHAAAEGAVVGGLTGGVFGGGGAIQGNANASLREARIAEQKRKLSNIKKTASSINESKTEQDISEINQSESVDEAISKASQSVSEDPVTPSDLVGEVTLNDIIKETGVSPDDYNVASEMTGTESSEMTGTESTQNDSTVPASDYISDSNVPQGNGLLDSSQSDLTSGFSPSNAYSEQSIQNALSKKDLGVTSNIPDPVTSNQDRTYFSFAGKNAKNANTDMLTQAETRLKDGDNPESVRRTTGWHRGVDGKMRFEISDNQMKVASPEEVNSKISSGESVTVGDITDHTKLFDNYPELSNVQVKQLPNSSENDMGGYDMDSNVLYLNVKGIEKAANKSDVPAQDRLNQVVIHELQHAIQVNEGFARGGSVSDGEKIALQASRDSHNKAVKQLEKYGKVYPKSKGALIDSMNNLGNVITENNIDVSKAGTYNELLNVVRNNVEGIDKQIVDKFNNNLHEAVNSEFKGDAESFKGFNEATNNYAKSLINGNMNPEEAYSRLAGEVESRNVESRVKLDDLDRKITSPKETQDRKDEKQIVTKDTSQASSASQASKTVPSKKGMTRAEAEKAATPLKGKWLGYQKVKIVDDLADITEGVRNDMLDAVDNDISNVEAFYSPNDDTVYALAQNFKNPDRLAWVLSHEVVGHAGLRMLDKSVRESVDMAGNNKYIKDLSKAIALDRNEDYQDYHIEEAIAETAAAIQTGDFNEIFNRYGIEVPRTMQSGIRAAISRVIAAVRSYLDSILAKKTTDKQVYDLIKQAKKAVETQQEEAFPGQGYRPNSKPALDNNVMVAHYDSKEVINNENYIKGRNGNYDAAMSAVDELVPDSALEFAGKHFGQDVIYAPVTEASFNGVNVVPDAMAIKYAQANDSDYESNILRINYENQNNNINPSTMGRLVYRAKFTGKVDKTKPYVLVKDINTTGSTLRDLALYIKSKGGKVAGSLVLTDNGKHDSIEPFNKTLKLLEEKHGNDYISEVLGVRIKDLTRAESQYLLGFRSTDELRNRISKEIQKRINVASRKEKQAANKNDLTNNLLRKDIAKKLNLSKSEEKDLLVQHSLTEENIIHAYEFGGLPVPSLAISKRGQADNYFGEIILLGNKEMIDPKGKNKSKVFGADIYSPRFPEVEDGRGGRQYIRNDSDKAIPYTVDNVVKVMKKNLRSGEKDIYSSGSARGTYTPQFKSINDIKKNKWRLVSSEESSNLDKELSDDIYELNRLMNEDSGRSDGLNSTFEFMVDAGKTNIDNALQINYMDGISDKTRDRIKELMEKLKNSPTDYFEAKITRLVGLGEFSAAVVPDYIKPSTLEMLKKSGITDIRTYEGYSSKVKDTLAAAKDLMFSKNPGEKSSENKSKEGYERSAEEKLKDRERINKLNRILGDQVADLQAKSVDVRDNATKASRETEEIAGADLQDKTSKMSFTDANEGGKGGEAKVLNFNDYSIRYSKRISSKNGENSDDYVMPESPAYKGVNNGNLNIIPEYIADAAGIDSLPIRVKIGEDQGKHRGFGLKHIHAEAMRDAIRKPTPLTNDLAENYARDIDELTQSFDEVYSSDNLTVLRDSDKQKALVVKKSRDDLSKEPFYSVITMRPAIRKEKGVLTWSGDRRQLHPNQLRKLVSTFATETQNSDSTRSAGNLQRNQARHLGAEELDTGNNDNIRFSKSQAKQEKDYSSYGEYGSSARTMGYPKEAGEPIATFKDTSAFKNHPLYKDAKHGDFNAAVNLVNDLDISSQLEEAKNRFGSEVVLSPVTQMEAFGVNAIPNALALKYAEYMGSKFNNDISVSKKAYHTGMNAMERIVGRVEFQGKVIKDAEYVLVDDVTTIGSTLADAASYIQNNGGKVVGSILLTNANRTDNILPDRKVIKQLEERHGQELNSIIGINAESLTKGEAGYLLGFRDTDELRGRANKSIKNRIERIRKKELSQRKDSIDSNKPRFSKSSSVEEKSRQEILGEVPEESKARLLQRKFQDKLNRFTVIRDWITDKGIKLTDKSNVYDAEERFHSKYANQVEDFKENTVKPIIKKVADLGYSMKDVEDFLLAQHAAEANAQIQKTTGDSDALAYGISDQEAKDYLDKANEDLKEVSNEFRKITEDTKNLLVKEGIITKEIADNWSEAYKHYVPVRGGDNEAANSSGTGSGLKAKHKDKRRLGHSLRNEFVVENIIQGYQRAVMEVEKNRVGKSLALMAAEIADDRIISIDKPEKRKVLRNQKSYEVMVPDKDDTYQSIHAFQSRESAKAFLKEMRGKVVNGIKIDSKAVIKTTTDPRVAYMASPMLQENEVEVYIDGHKIRLQINDDLLARAYGNLGQEALGAILSTGRALNGYLSKVYTAYNPEFFVTNMARDFVSGLSNITGEKGFAYAIKTMANYPKAFSDLLGYALSGKPNKLIQDYRDNGGNTGAAYLSDIERMTSDISTDYASYEGVYKNLKKGQRLMATRAAGRKTFNSTLKYMEALNQAGENAMRLSVFKVAQDSGLGNNKAAKLAKNVTVNFNRKGELGGELNSLFLFFNASVQGTAAIGHAFFKGEHKGQLRALTSGMVGLGYTLAMAAGSGDDADEYDKIPDYIKERNILIKSGDKWIKIPVPYGYGFFYSLGRNVADGQRKGDLGLAAYHSAVNAVEELTPFGSVLAGEGDSTQAMIGAMPTAMQILATPAFNRNTMGSQVMPDSQYDPYMPDREKMWRSTKGTSYDTVAGWLTEAGIDVSPETLKHYTRTFTGGAGASLDTAISAASMKSQGADLDLAEIPVIRRFVGEVTVKDSRAAYYEAKQESDKAAADFNRARRNRDLSKAGDIMKEKSEMIALSRYANKLSKQIKVLRDRQDNVKQNESIPLAQQRLALKELERQEEHIHDTFLKAHGLKKNQ